MSALEKAIEPDENRRSFPRLSPRIWRSGKCNFYGDEAFDSPVVYSRRELEKIRADGFDGVWLRGRLFDMMQSTVFPELNRPLASRRIERLQALVRRGQEAGVGVWLYFNEPLAVPASHPFWKSHSEVRGASHLEPIDDPYWNRSGSSASSEEPVEMVSLCPSSVAGRLFFRESVGTLLTQLEGLAGVILITASEHHSHCWSHHPLLDTGFLPPSNRELSCEACRNVGPARVVLDILETWRQATRDMKSPCRVMAQNWSWSMWYSDPQKEIVQSLPEGVELLADWERGGSKRWMNRTIAIDEYAMSYIGPSPRFLETKAAAANTPVHVKLQINTTHELATVPNLPLLPNLHAKWVRLQKEGVAGMMGCWNFGCAQTLNTAAFRIFHETPSRWEDLDAFLNVVAASHFGEVDANAMSLALGQFCAAFEFFPFSFDILYHSPINYAPAYPLSPNYRGEAMGCSWIQHQWGDRLDDTLQDWPLDEVVGSFEMMCLHWEEGLANYRVALATAECTSRQKRHRREELSCAEMIGCHLSSALNIYRFHRWRSNAIRLNGLVAPCAVPLDDAARSILRDELEGLPKVIALMKGDSRLGFHEEAQAYLFDVSLVDEKRRNIATQIQQTVRPGPDHGS